MCVFSKANCEFIEVSKTIDLSLSKKQDIYIPFFNIIAFVDYRESIIGDSGFIYKDITKPEKWSFQSWKSFAEKLNENFLVLNSEYDKLYKNAVINSDHINCLIDNGIDFLQINTTSNLTFIHKDIDAFQSLCHSKSFIESTTPLNYKCYINIHNINSIEPENYITIDPLLVEKYLKAADVDDKCQLLHIIFNDSSTITVLGEN